MEEKKLIKISHEHYNGIATAMDTILMGGSPYLPDAAYWLAMGMGAEATAQHVAKLAKAHRLGGYTDESRAELEAAALPIIRGLLARLEESGSDEQYRKIKKLFAKVNRNL